MILDPKVLSSIKGLSLMARTSLEGYNLGLNLNFKKGQGQEFSNYRSYEPGDDLRNLDWKMFARSDRYYVRESEIETQISIRFLIDASASMNHEDSGITKFKYVQVLTACMAYLAARQGDYFGLSLFGESGMKSILRQSGKNGFERFCHLLESTPPGGVFPSDKEILDLGSRNDPKTLYIFISDFYQIQEEHFNMLDALRGRGHEIWALQILGKNELDFHFPDYSQLEDLETGSRISINQGNRVAFKERMELHLDSLKKKILDKNIVYSLFLLSNPLNEAIKQFLKRTQKGK